MHRVWIVAVLLASAVVARGQHTLRYSIEPGLTYRFEQTVSMQMDLEMQSGWQQMQVDQASDQVTRGSIEVLEVESGVTSRARVIFDRDSGTTMTSSLMPQPQGTAFELAGRAVLASIGPGGTLTITDEDGDPLRGLMPDTTQLVRSLAIPDAAFPPKQPVQVGDAWTARLGSASDPVRPEYTFTLKSVEDGRAELTAQGRIASEAEGITFAAELAGDVAVDVRTGLPIASTLSGPLTSGGEANNGGVVTTIKGSGTIRQTTTISFGGASREADREGDSDAGDSDGWEVYTHAASGVSFKHPAGWRIQDTPQGIQIIPTGFDQTRELLFGFGAPAQGETDAASPAARQNLDMILRAQAPTLMSQGAPERLDVDEGSAAMYRYAGPMPDGSPGACTVFVRILGETAVAMGIAGTEAKVAERSPTLRGMFDSLTLQTRADRAAAEDGEADTDDRRLIGMFRGEAISSNVEGIYINTQLVYAIGADGRVHYGAKSAMAASKRDHNQDLVWTASGESAGEVQSGDWSATNGVLTVKWDNGGQSVFAYGFEPDGSLVLRNPRTRELINFFPRVR